MNSRPDFFEFIPCRNHASSLLILREEGLEESDNAGNMQKVERNFSCPLPASVSQRKFHKKFLKKCRMCRGKFWTQEKGRKLAAGVKKVIIRYLGRICAGGEMKHVDKGTGKNTKRKLWCAGNMQKVSRNCWKPS